MLASESLGKKSVALGVLSTNEQHPSDEHRFGLRVCSNCEAKTIKTIKNHLFLAQVDPYPTKT
jgi:hypothetical protein